MTGATATAIPNERDARMPLADGTAFAGYTIPRLLGSGGMGEVYLAQHPRLATRRAETAAAAHTVPGVLEPPAPVRLNRRAQHLVMGGQRHPHAIGVGLPPTGRTLDIGEQKRHHPRRSSRPITGHPRRISQQTRAYLAHRRIRARSPDTRVFETNFRESRMFSVMRPAAAHREDSRSTGQPRRSTAAVVLARAAL